MSRRAPVVDVLESPSAVAATRSRRSSSSSVNADRDLVQRCLDGIPGAWDDLYEHCHLRLIHAIRRMVGPAVDLNVVDEIAARVWYTIVRSDFELLARFDTSRGCRLSTFLRGIARKEFAAYSRAERRRRMREFAVSQSAPHVASSGFPFSRSELAEFMNQLTRSERAFCDHWLLAPPVARQAQAGVVASGLAWSDANIRQLRHRIRRKLDRFLNSR